MSRQHGYVATYQHGCRCEQCREASALYRGVSRRRTMAADFEWPEAWWTAAGSCVGEDPNIWFPTSTKDEAAAVAICRECPVKEECRDYALRIREPWGIWGGLTEGDRRRILRQRAKRTA